METTTPNSNEAALRDWLAVERTKLANQRTLLSMLRTGSYFLVMGLTIFSLEQLEALQQYYWLFFLFGFGFIAVGIVYFIRVKKNIKNTYERTL